MPKIQNIKQKQYCNKFNEVFKNGPHQKKQNKKNPKIVAELVFWAANDLVAAFIVVLCLFFLFYV